MLEDVGPDRIVIAFGRQREDLGRRFRVVGIDHDLVVVDHAVIIHLVFDIHVTAGDDHVQRRKPAFLDRGRILEVRGMVVDPFAERLVVVFGAERFVQRRDARAVRGGERPAVVDQQLARGRDVLVGVLQERVQRRVAGRVRDRWGLARVDQLQHQGRVVRVGRHVEQ